jgi:predicted metal-dependent hydrolase
LVPRLAHLAALHGFTYNRVSVRGQKTRWGSCSHKNNISLNRMLVHLPEALVDYILLHELVHTRIKNHGRLFWEALTQCLPNARSLDRELNQYWMLLVP